MDRFSRACHTENKATGIGAVGGIILNDFAFFNGLAHITKRQAVSSGFLIRMIGNPITIAVCGFGNIPDFY